MTMIGLRALSRSGLMAGAVALLVSGLFGACSREARSSILVEDGPEGGPARPRDGFVYRRGMKLMLGDAEFKPVGVNLGNWFVQELYLMLFEEKKVDEATMRERLRRAAGGPAGHREWMNAWRENFISEADIRRIAAEGYNTVRVPLRVEDFTTSEGGAAATGAYGGALPDTAPEGLLFIDRLVAWCDSHGIRIMLDMHRYGPGSDSFYVASDSQVNPKLERIKAAWETIARRYAGVGTILGYDFLNEPPGYTDHLIRPTYEQLVRHVRRFDTDHLVIIESNIYSDLGNPTNWTLGAPLDENMAVSVHYYNPWREPAPVSFDADGPDGRKYLAWRYCHDHRLPLVIGEVGENALEVTQSFVRLFRAGKDGLTAGTIYWTYKKLGDQWGCVVNVPTVEGWDRIRAFVHGEGQLPRDAREILMAMARGTNDSCARYGTSDGWGTVRKAMLE